MKPLSENDKRTQLFEEGSLTASGEENTSRGRTDRIVDQLGDAYTSFTSRGLPWPEEKSELEVCNESRAASNGEVTKSIGAVKRGICQLPNLDLSLLPPLEAMGTRSFPYQHKGRPAASAQRYCSVPYSPNPDVYRSPKAGAEQPPCAQLTIFYAGAVNVYNVSEDKAKAILMTASRISSSPDSRTPSSSAPKPPMQLNSTPRRMDMAPIISSASPGAILSNTQSSQTIKTADLQISRKGCIQRFLEKRKERILGKGPYLLRAQK